MNFSLLFVAIFTFLIPIFTPYGYKFFSYADPLLLGRDYLFDMQKNKLNLKKLWLVLVSILACLIVFEIFNKQKIAIISLSVSMFSETLDYLLTRNFINSRIRGYITVFANFIDTVLFVSLAYFFKALNELDYNIFIDFFIMNTLYIIFFMYRYRVKNKPQNIV